MKKTYFKPETEVMNTVCCQPLLAGSIAGEMVLDEDAGTDVPGLAPGLPTLNDLLGLPTF